MTIHWLHLYLWSVLYKDHIIWNILNEFILLCIIWFCKHWPVYQKPVPPNKRNWDLKNLHHDLNNYNADSATLTLADLSTIWVRTSVVVVTLDVVDMFSVDLALRRWISLKLQTLTNVIIPFLLYKEVSFMIFVFAKPIKLWFSSYLWNFKAVV